MILQEVVYDYSCLMVSVPATISKELIRFSKSNIPDNVLVVNDDAKGRENDFHVTLKYGLTEAKPSDKLLDLFQEYRPFIVKIGNISFFKNVKEKGFDVVKCDIESEGLYELNKQVCKICPTEDEYSKYRPHLTLAYVQPDSCSHLKGKSPLKKEKNEFIVDKIIFSPPGDDENLSKQLFIPLNNIDYKSFFK